VLPALYLNIGGGLDVTFNQKDMVVITGVIKTNGSCKLTAGIYEICFVGLRDLLVFPINGYNKRIFKINKALCEKIELKKPLVKEDIIEPKIGSLVLAWDATWDGIIKEQFVGHIQEIQDSPGRETFYIILANNKSTRVCENLVLLLEY